MSNPCQEPKKAPRWLLATMLSLILVSCQNVHKSRLVTPEGTFSETLWPQTEKIRDVTIHRIWQSPGVSFHEVRLQGNEKPHVHDGHDLTVVIRTGKARLHFIDHAVELEQGDVLAIPRGVTHWAENRGKNASEAYAIFSPPFDGKDYRSAEIRENENDR